MSNLLEKLGAIKERWDEVSQLILDPEIISDMKRYVKLNKEYKDLQIYVDTFHSYRNVLENISSSKEIIDSDEDPELKEMARMELDDLEPKRDAMEEEIKVLLIPKDPDDAKDVILEIRAGTGGDEASLFVGDLYRMYMRYFEKNGLKVDLMSLSEGTAGGYKEIVCSVAGQSVFGILKFESGVHRVQRVPATESQGRVHTSAATVVVLPEADEVDVELNMEDVKVDTYRASGAGGQHVNKTESAVRLTHIPTGIVVECQEGRSQHKNKDKAITILRTRMYEAEAQKLHAERAAARKSQVASGDRSEKIRTYNYPQGRVTDHRIGLTLYNLDNIMNGDMAEIIDALKLAENAEKLQAGMES